MVTVNNNEDYVNALRNDKHDPELGKRVREYLVSKGLETVLTPNGYQPEEAFAHLFAGIEEGLAYLGLDRNDPSTKDTPRRYAAMLVGDLTWGLNYNFFPKCTTTPNGTDTGLTRPTGYLKANNKPAEEPVIIGAYNQMVLVREIETISLCEHHLQTIYGYTHIAYIPRTKVLGLSKFARVTEFFARRPQIQERMTEQIFEALSFILETDDIAVVVDATHYCMKARGALQNRATTQTNKMGGRFFSQPSLRQEFLDAIRR